MSWISVITRSALAAAVVSYSVSKAIPWGTFTTVSAFIFALCTAFAILLIKRSDFWRVFRAVLYCLIGCGVSFVFAGFLGFSMSDALIVMTFGSGLGYLIGREIYYQKFEKRREAVFVNRRVTSSQ